MKMEGEYGFEYLPIEAVPAGTNILVAGPSLGGARELLLELLADNDGQEGIVFISADIAGTKLIDAYQSIGGQFDPGRMCVIDCTKQQSGSDGPIRHVASPSDLTGIGIEFSSLFESLHGRGSGRVRVGIWSLSTLLMYADDFRAVYRFLHTLTSRIRTADGLGLAAIDPEATDQQALGTISQAFDARIDVRESEAGAEFRVKGLDGPTDWEPIPDA